MNGLESRCHHQSPLLMCDFCLYAGTGKTETVKELSRCVARQCVVFNTTEQLDVSHMTRLLMGTASTGAWSCFDEFNRMDMEVLSVVAKQIMTIQAALAAGERYFMFEGRNLGINTSMAMFITMNPMYEFRNVLPSNLKVWAPVSQQISRCLFLLFCVPSSPPPESPSVTPIVCRHHQGFGGPSPQCTSALFHQPHGLILSGLDCVAAGTVSPGGHDGA